MPLTTINDDDFHKLTQFIHQNYGINLQQKRQLVTSRLSSLVMQKGYNDFTPFVQALLRDKNPADMEAVLNRLTTNYTFFMRETEHFDFFTKTVLPELVRRHQRDRVMAIWSAGCSSGEEPYNISIYIKEFLGAQASNWDTRVLATDISQKALYSAKRGVYELPDTIPFAWRKKYFQPVSGGNISNLIFLQSQQNYPIRMMS